MIYSWQIGGGIMSHIYCFLFKKQNKNKFGMTVTLLELLCMSYLETKPIFMSSYTCSPILIQIAIY